jgi:hypothetical protein
LIGGYVADAWDQGGVQIYKVRQVLGTINGLDGLALLVLYMPQYDGVAADLIEGAVID